MLSPLIVILVPIIVGSLILIIYHLTSEESNLSSVSIIPFGLALYLLDEFVLVYESMQPFNTLLLCGVMLLIVAKSD